MGPSADVPAQGRKTARSRRTSARTRRDREGAMSEEKPSLGMFSQMGSDTAKALPARNFIDDEMCNRRDLPPRYVPSIIHK